MSIVLTTDTSILLYKQPIMHDVDLILKTTYTTYKLKAVNTRVFTDIKRVHSHTIITEGTSSVHIRGITKGLYMLFKGLYGSSTLASQSNKQWQVISCSSFITHIMKLDVRTFYSMDSLFNNEMNLKTQVFNKYT